MKRLATRARSVRSAIALSAAALALGAATPAAAAGVLDQSNLAGPDGAPATSAVTANRHQTQFFTAGLTGQLSQVNFQLVTSGTAQEVRFSLITGGAANLPAGNPASWISFTVPTTATGFGTTNLDLGSYGYNVVAGQQYGLMLWIGEGFGSTNWVFGSDPDSDPGTDNPVGLSYAGGNNFVRQGGGAWSATGFDRGFQTFVDTAAVPEPETWALLIVGMGGVGAAMRRRRMTMRYRTT